MGDVYLAEHLLLKRPCAIKLIRGEKAGDAEAFKRFEREVRATAQLTHWNTVEIFDYGRSDNGSILLCDGIPAGDESRSARAAPWSTAGQSA